MVKAGDVVLFEFPAADQQPGKLRPALVLASLPGNYDDYLVCMITTQLHQKLENFDEVISPSDSDFESSGLKAESLIRIFRLAVVEKEIFEGIIGEISASRLTGLRGKLSNWLEPPQN